MVVSAAGLVERLRSPGGQKLLRYSAASVVAVIVSVVCLVIFNGLLRWPAVVSSTAATAIATIPSYELNRKWAWGKTGKSHMWKEVVPFWVLSFLGWALSTLAVDIAENYAVAHNFSHTVKTGLVTVVYVGAFGVLWVGKFVIFNRVLFVHRHHDEAHPSVDSTPAGRPAPAGSVGAGRYREVPEGDHRYGRSASRSVPAADLAADEAGAFD